MVSFQVKTPFEDPKAKTPFNPFQIPLPMDEPNFEKSHRDLKKALIFQDIRSFHLETNNSKIIPPFGTLPATIKEIDIVVSYNRKDYLRLREKEFNPDSMKHLHNLEKFSFPIQVVRNGLIKMLDSLPEPSKLKSLGLSLSQASDDECFNMVENLDRFPNLNSLHLEFGENYLEFGILERLEGYNHLKHFKISVLIHGEEELSYLGTGLSRIQSLKSLELSFTGLSWMIIPGSLQALFEGICDLQELEVLKIKIDYQEIGENNRQVKGSLKGFSHCIARLPKLKEISFVQDHADFEGEFGDLAKVLKEKYGNLRSLEIGTQRNQYPRKVFRCKEEDMKVFLEAIRNMMSLEKLVLVNFRIEEKEILKELLTIIRDLRGLRELFMNFDGKVEERYAEGRLIKNADERDFSCYGDSEVRKLVLSCLKK